MAFIEFVPPSPVPAEPNDSTPWRVVVRPPKGRESSLYLRARRTVDREREEKTKTTGTMDEREAEQLRLEWEAMLNGTALPDDPTLLEVYDAHVRGLELSPDSKRGTVANYRTARNALLETALMGVRVSELSRRHLLAAQTALRASGPKGSRAPRTVNNWLDFVKAAWHAGMKAERISKLWPSLDPLSCKTPTRPKRALEVEEQDMILLDLSDNDPLWYRPFMLLAATTQRISDVLTRKAQDVMSGTIVVRARKQGDPSEVGVPAVVMELLAGKRPGDWLFPTPGDPSRPLNRASALKALRRSLKRLADKITDSDWIDVHSFRRSGCADLMDAGVPAHQAQMHSGHSSLRMFNLYASKARARRVQTAEQLAGYRRQRLGGRDLGVPGVDSSESTEQTGESEPPAVSPTVPLPGRTPACKLSADMVQPVGIGMGALARPPGHVA